MVFSSLTFLQCFLPLCLLAYFLVPQKWRNGTLFLFSLLFYAWGEPVYVFLMLLTTLVDYTAGRIIDRFDSSKKNNPEIKRTIFLVLFGEI